MPGLRRAVGMPPAPLVLLLLGLLGIDIGMSIGIPSRLRRTRTGGGGAPVLPPGRGAAASSPPSPRHGEPPVVSHELLLCWYREDTLEIRENREWIK